MQTAAAFEARTSGIVLLHGKRRDPSDLAPLAETLRGQGFVVETPEAPWSARRLYDRAPEEATQEFSLVVARLRSHGLKRIVIGGHSSGAAGALRYAAAHKVAALVLIAPAPVLESTRFHDYVAAKLTQARELVDTGEGDRPETFDDFNSLGESVKVTMTARCFLEYNSPDGPAAMSRAVTAIGSIPVLWIAPTDDPNNEAFQQFIIAKLPASARLTKIDIPGGHMGAPLEAVKPIVAWLTGL
jgi:pimeloyl-ACP methyl ester carboxylesterase